MEEAATQHPKTPAGEESLAKQYLWWVDGAGTFLLCLSKEVTFGGVSQSQDRADVCVMANLSRRHFTLVRAEGAYHIQPQSRVKLDHRELPTNTTDSFPLGQSATLELGQGVELEFRQPTILSLTANLEFQSGHRPMVCDSSSMVDQVILMDQNCLLGPGGGQHVRCDDCERGVILYRGKGRLWCKSNTLFSVNEQPLVNSSVLKSGDVVTGEDFGFRLEAVAENLR